MWRTRITDRVLSTCHSSTTYGESSRPRTTTEWMGHLQWVYGTVVEKNGWSERHERVYRRRGMMYVGPILDSGERSWRVGSCVWVERSGERRIRLFKLGDKRKNLETEGQETELWILRNLRSVCSRTSCLEPWNPRPPESISELRFWPRTPTYWRSVRRPSESRVQTHLSGSMVKGWGF